VTTAIASISRRDEQLDKRLRLLARSAESILSDYILNEFDYLIQENVTLF